MLFTSYFQVKLQFYVALQRFILLKGAFLQIKSYSYLNIFSK